jgi:hypothetical protein
LIPYAIFKILSVFCQHVAPEILAIHEVVGNVIKVRHISS